MLFTRYEFLEDLGLWDLLKRTAFLVAMVVQLLMIVKLQSFWAA